MDFVTNWWLCDTCAQPHSFDADGEFACEKRMSRMWPISTDGSRDPEELCDHYEPKDVRADG